MTSLHRRTRAFTLAELIVALSAVALLLFVLAPGLKAARGAGRQQTCLANLMHIGVATQAYALEDPVEQIVPLHQMMRQRTASYFNGTIWGYRAANWFAWGGVTAAERFLVSCRESRPACGPIVGGPGCEVYATETRPLNGYVSGFEVYHCPQDVGYPDSPLIYEAPRTNALRPLYDTLGNSYYASLYCYVSDYGAFSIGPWGHRLSTLERTDRLILLGDPLFFAGVGIPPGQLPWSNWHGDHENLVFCDGSARPVDSPPYVLTYEANPDPREVGPNFNLMSRWSAGNFDTYPTPGALIWGPPPDRWRRRPSHGRPNEWPFRDYQNNFGDPGPRPVGHPGVFRTPVPIRPSP